MCIRFHIHHEHVPFFQAQVEKVTEAKFPSAKSTSSHTPQSAAQRVSLHTHIHVSDSEKVCHRLD